jgi:hypothetical protein
MRTLPRLMVGVLFALALASAHAAVTQTETNIGVAAKPETKVAAKPEPKAEANMMLLEVRLGQHLLSDAVTAWQFGQEVFLPLGELSRLLTIAIRATPDDGRASGYVLSEARNFSLDIARQSVTVDGRSTQFDPSWLRREADDIYVARSVLATWLPVDLDLDVSTLTLKVRPREQLPLQARFERLERGLGAASGTTTAGFPLQPTPYRLLDTPFIDQTFNVDVASNDGRRERNASYTAYLTADLLGLEASLYVSRNGSQSWTERSSARGADQVTERPVDQNLDVAAAQAAFRAAERAPNVRLTLGRHDQDAGLLGPLRARSVEVGSVALAGIDHIAFGSPTGNGLVLSNRPLDQPTRFDSHSLRGDLPPGWDVELYFNDALVAFQQSRPDGKYSFEDQPLIYGTNEFRLVFHGPLGQLRIERKSFLLEQSALAAGSVFYSVGTQHDGEGRRRTLAQFDLGLWRNLAANVGLARVPSGDGDAVDNYASVGMRGYWQAFIFSADAARAGHGGTLASATLKTRLAGMSVSASSTRLRDFISELFQDGADPVRARDELRLDGAPAWLPLLPLSLQLRRDTLASGLALIDLQARFSAYRQGTAVSSGWHLQTLAGQRSLDGVLQVSRRIAGTGLSAQLQYDLTPRARLSGLALTADRNLADGYQATFGLARSLLTEQTRASAALTKSLGSYGLGVNGFYTSAHSFGLGIQLFVALGREPRRSRWLVEAQPMANMGAASIRVFLDKNQNGVMDAGDEPVKGAGFTVNGGANLARTDANGIALIKRLPAWQFADVGVDAPTLEDPQWQPQRRGVRLVPRPGKVSQVDFAVSMTGEIDGTALLQTASSKRGIGDLQLELLDASGAVVASVKSAADGYFVLQAVPPGAYQLRISPEQLTRLKLRGAGPQAVRMSADGEFVNGREFIVSAALDAPP